MPKKNTPHFLMIITLVLITNYITLGMNITNSSIIEEEEERPRRLKNKIKKDIKRYMGISERLKLRSKTRKLIDEEEIPIPIEERQEPMKSIIDGAVKLPMYAAAEYEMGEYVVDIEVGNPPKKLHLVVDTASDLTWVKCKTHNFGILDENNVLDVDNSLTYQPISCAHSLCKEDFAPLSALEDCPTTHSPCMYNYSYGDAGLSTYGMFGKEMITLPTTTGKPVVLENLLVGCSESYTDKDRMKKADGVLGLGINPYSFSVHAVTLLGGCFSYCLVDHLSPLNITNYLIFGNYREKSPTQDYMRFTTLQVSESAPYFWVNVKGISIDDKMLDIDPMVWDRNIEGGTILDSGTAATYWATPAYQAIMDVLIPVLEKDYPKLPEGLGDGKLDFEYCFNSTKTPFKPKKVPRLGIHFRDGARFTPLVKSYIVDDGPGVNCIGFLEAPAGLNIIGNIMQQNYLWEFDLQQNTVGFAASVCK